MNHVPHSLSPSGPPLPVSLARALFLLSLGLAASLLPCLADPISITGTGTYSQNFDALVATGTSATWADDSTIPGWYSQRTGTGATIVVGTGTSTGGGLYSFGSESTTERALGTIGSGNAAAGHFAHGVLLKNDDTVTLTVTNVTYRGEQWRNSAAAAQSITFWYQVSPSAITSLTPNVNTEWTAVSSLDFTSPITGGTAGALDGNVGPNFTAISPGTSIAVPAGQYLMLRWSDPDHSGSDHGLSIDDVTIGWGSTALPSLSLSLASSSIVEGGVSEATMTRTGDLTSALTVDVATSDATAATTPATASFLANSATATFNVTGFNDTIQDGTQSANITVSFTGYTADVKPIAVDDDDSDLSLLTINEVCADATADHNGDGTISNTADEFIELVNTSGANLDISAWTISDNSGVTFTFPASTVLVTGQAAVIFGGGTIPPTFGSAIAFKANSGLNLNNSGGDLVAVHNGATLIAKMAYSANVTGQVPSFNLNGDIIPGPFVLHTSVTGAVGDVSPGKRVNQTEYIVLSPLTLTLLPTSIAENGGISKATVTRPGPTVGGLVIALSSSDITEAVVPSPATVEIPDGQASAEFTITGVDDIEPDGPFNVTITASAIGFAAAQAVLEVTSDTDAVPAATLAPGAIAFVAYNADGGDDFAFVALATIPEGTQIRFTDNEWNGLPIGSGGQFNTGEGFVAWLAPSGGVPAGTVIQVRNTSDSTSIKATIDGTAAYGTISGFVNMNAGDETLYAYQGTELRASGFLSVIATHDADSVAETGLSASNLIYLPADVDVAEYVASRSSKSSFADYLALIVDTAGANWVTQDGAADNSYDGTAPDVPFNATPFTLGTGDSFASWITGFQVNGLIDPNDDFDNDGLDNMVENILGSDPSVTNAGLNTVSGTANSVTFQHTRADTPATDLTATYEWSADLANWYPSGPGGGVTVTIGAPVVINNGSPNDIVQVTATVTSGSTTQLFVRLKVGQ